MGFVDHLGLLKAQPQHNLGFLWVTLLTTLLDNNAARAIPSTPSMVCHFTETVLSFYRFEIEIPAGFFYS